MDLLLIATQDQAVHAIRAHVDRPGIDPTLTALVHAVLAVHRIDPPEDAGKAVDGLPGVRRLRRGRPRVRGRRRDPALPLPVPVVRRV